jgi:hypothetical protein
MTGSVSQKLALNLPASNPPGYPAAPGFDMRSDQPPQLTSGSPSSVEHVTPATAGHRQSGKRIIAEPGEEEVVHRQCQPARAAFRRLVRARSRPAE